MRRSLLRRDRLDHARYPTGVVPEPEARETGGPGMERPPASRGEVRGWGRATASVATVLRPEDEAAWARLVSAPGPRGLIPRGAGSGYGDCAQNAGGVVALSDPEPPIGVDVRDGTVVVDAGVRLSEVMRRLVPQGWTLPVLPGTTEVSVGGAIAADVHGKNHPEAGAFSACVSELTLLAPGTGPVVVGPRLQPDVFWATVGGLGLTGVIRRARLCAQRLESTWMLAGDRVEGDLDAVLTRLREAHATGAHAVAWVDGHASGGRLGRGIVSTARYALPSDLPARRRPDPLAYPPRRRLPVPSLPGRGVVRPAVIAAANRTHLATAARRTGTRLLPLSGVLHPLDAVRGTPGLYGRAGLVQYQFVVPAGADCVLREALLLPQREGCPPSLVVLKLLGAADPAPLSFPQPGWTLALDFSAAAPGLGAVLDRLDELVAAVGGRIYLVKDSRMRPDLVEAMYPLLPDWRVVRDRLDPRGLMSSDLDRRLDLTGRRTA